MLISKTAKVKWNSKIKKHYVDLGYKFTKMHDEFEVKVNDLTTGSNSIVTVECDYCKRIYTKPWFRYGNNKEYVNLDCCDNSDCISQKADAVKLAKFGTVNIREIEWVNEKRNNTNLKKYGSNNVFGNKEIQAKIRRTNLEKYGVEVPTQNKDVYQKVTNTCMKKYGVPCFLNKDYSSESIRGKNNPRWRGGVAYHGNERATFELLHWKKEIREKYGMTCDKCGITPTEDNPIRMETHHLYNFKKYKTKRYDLDNGVLLCQKCHIAFHTAFGKKDNNPEQYKEFLKM